MKKIETIWRELLFQAIRKNNREFTQKEIASQFGFSTSTVFQALKIPRKMGAVRVTGRYFVLEDSEKLLYHWASDRNLQRDIIYSTHIDSSVIEIEAKMPPGVIFGSFSAARQILAEPPADYDKVYVYATDLGEIKKRFKSQKGRENLFILKADNFLARYGQITSISQNHFASPHRRASRRLHCPSIAQRVEADVLKPHHSVLSFMLIAAPVLRVLLRHYSC